MALSAAAVSNPDLLTDIANAVGRQSVVAVIDFRNVRFLSTTYQVCTHNANVSCNVKFFDLVKTFRDSGVGKLFSIQLVEMV